MSPQRKEIENVKERENELKEKQIRYAIQAKTNKLKLTRKFGDLKIFRASQKLELPKGISKEERAAACRTGLTSGPYGFTAAGVPLDKFYSELPGTTMQSALLPSWYHSSAQE